MASSSRVRRTWRTTAGWAHHIADPRTGSPSHGPLGATIVAADCWWAEAVGTALLAGDRLDASLIGRAHAVVVTADGQRHATTGLTRAVPESFVLS